MSYQVTKAGISRFNEHTFGTQNDKVVFFFAGMGTRTWLYTLPLRHLVRRGYTVVAYDFNPGIVRKGDADTFLSVAETVSRRVTERIEDFQAAGVKSFAAFGVSMGTLFAIKVATENKAISKLIINLTYGSVAENVWTWKFIERTKRLSIAQGYTMETLDRKLAPVSPIPNAKKLRGKKVLLYLSSKDKILLFKQSRAFKDALDEAGVEYVYVQNDRHGHIVAGWMNMRRREVWTKFLNEDIV